jgi:hypothetical protein
VTSRVRRQGLGRPDLAKLPGLAIDWAPRRHCLLCSPLDSPPEEPAPDAVLFKKCEICPWCSSQKPLPLSALACQTCTVSIIALAGKTDQLTAPCRKTVGVGTETGANEIRACGVPFYSQYAGMKYGAMTKCSAALRNSNAATG